jgi:hypothetical protein
MKMGCYTCQDKRGTLKFSVRNEYHATKLVRIPEELIMKKNPALQGAWKFITIFTVFQ